MKAEVSEVKEQTQVFFNNIDTIQSYGVNAADINKLKAAGFCTTMSVLQSRVKELINVKGISEAKLDKIKEACQKVEGEGLLTATQLLKKREQVLRITTGSSKLDKLLGGGIESQSITEIHGESKVGKSQLCHMLCVTAQMPRENGGGGGKAAYIDTEGTFRPERIKSIADSLGLNSEQVLDNIVWGRAMNSEHQQDLLKQIAACMIEEPFAILIVDSIIALFRSEFSGRGELSDRQQKLNKFLGQLRKLSEQFNIAVFVTNQVMSDPGATMSFVPDPKKPVGGHILAHAATTRLFARKGKSESKVVKLIQSPYLPDGEANIMVTEAGITDGSD